MSTVYRTPLSSLSSLAKEGIGFTENVKAPSNNVAIKLPLDGGRGEKTKTLEDATHKPLSPIIKLPKSINNNSSEQTHNSSLSIVAQSPIVKHKKPQAKDSKNTTTNPIIRLKPPSMNPSPSIAVKEKIEFKTTKKTKEVYSPSTKKKSTTNLAPPIVLKEKKENKTKAEEEIELGKKDAEEQMEALRSYKIGNFVNNNDPKACDGRGIFVYNLPSKFNKDLLGYCNDMITWMDFCKFLSNNGFGEPIHELGDGWYNTHQYSLEPIFHTRILKHPCRVYNPEEAKVFYVPYYGGLDILRWHFKKNITLQMKDKLSYELIEWLSQQAPWKKNFGLDHLFVLGKISWDFRRWPNYTWGTHFLDLDEMQSPMKLLIERHPWHINDIGVPHPSFFHPRSDNDIFAWQNKLMQQCTSSPDKCKFFDCRGGRCTQPAPMVHLFTDSEFCLQPVGDSPTRKSVFDSLVSGCIPVLFSPFTAYYQYPWHLPLDRSKYSVFVDQDEVRRRQVNVVDRLIAISPAQRTEMRRYIVYELLPGLVYADPEAKLNKSEDAFSVAMNSVLERMSRLP
ncbi:hypothetical protein V2J09_020248 [Rumex salicifolius]